jgi:CBS domain-containing protein
MREGLVTGPEHARLGEAARTMLDHGVHAVVVVDERGKPSGVLSDTDLLACAWMSTGPEELEPVRSAAAGDRMSHPILTSDVTAPAGIAAERMREESVSRLVVVRQGKPIGVLSVSDLVAELADAPPERSTVADVMSRGVVAVLPDTTVSQAARVMTERRSRALVVLDAGGRLLGLVTGVDLVRLWEKGVRTPGTIEPLVRPPVTVEPGASIREAADLMLRREAPRLVVVDPAGPRGVPLGLVSTWDVLAELADTRPLWRAPP